MAIRVVLDGPPGRGESALLRRGAAFTTGLLLMALAIVAACVMIPVTVLFGAVLFSGSLIVSPFVPVIAWIGGAVGTFLAYAGGRRLVAGNRHVVLFLRRFGHAEATGAVTAAVTGIGASWRVVTLDDGATTPVGVRGRTTIDAVERAGGRTASLMSAAGRAIMVVSGLCVLALVPLSHPDGLLLRRLGFVTPSEQGHLLYNLVLYAIVAPMLVGFACAIARVVLAPALAAATTLTENVQEADAGRHLRITGPGSIEPARRTVVALSRKAISARLFVLTVDTSVWRPAVVAFAEVATVPLIDVTHPTANVLWEIDQVQRTFGRRCVFVGQYERLGHLFMIPEPGSLTEALQRRLSGFDVLAYHSGPGGRRRFVRALRSTLEHRAASPR
jgi:hypothetical protein